MASLEELEKKVKELQKQLQVESEKTTAVEKEVQNLSEEVATLKSKSSTPSKTETTTMSEAPMERKQEMAKENGNAKKVEKSDTKEANEESSSEEEESSSEKEQEPKEKAPVETSEEPSNNPILKEGFLEKKGAIRHNWLKRWFELDSKNKYLIYYDKKGDLHTKGVIPLTNATCYAHVEKKGVTKPLFFNIRTETRDFLIRAESQEEKNAWVKLIKSQCVKGELTPEGRKYLSKKSSTFIGRASEEDSKKK